MSNIVKTAINRNPALKGVYERLVAEVKKFGPVTVEEKKTSVHIKAKAGFAGVHPRKDGLIVQIVTDAPIADPRVFKTEQVSKNRFHNHIWVGDVAEIDGKLKEWLKAAYDLMG
ncbi:MAG: DUF5655 domain-containing protein [Limisphaerales bacterium]